MISTLKDLGGRDRDPGRAGGPGDSHGGGLFLRKDDRTAWGAGRAGPPAEGRSKGSGLGMIRLT